MCLDHIKCYREAEWPGLMLALFDTTEYVYYILCHSFADQRGLFGEMQLEDVWDMDRSRYIRYR